MALDPTMTNDIVSWAVGVPSIGVLIAYGISIIRRKASADSKAITEDKTYVSMLNTYREERDELRADRTRLVDRIALIEAERNESVAKVGKLTAEVEFLSAQVGELKTLIEKLGNSLELSRTELHKFAVDNARLSAQVSYLENTMKVPVPHVGESIGSA